MILDRNYELTILNGEGSCSRAHEILEFDFDALMKDCVHNFNLASGPITLFNKLKEKTFAFTPKVFTAKHGKIYFFTEQWDVSDAAESTSIFNLDIQCLKRKENDLSDYVNILDDCFTQSKIAIDGFKSESDDKSLQLEEIIDREVFEYFGVKEDIEDSRVQDLKASIVNGIINLTAKVSYIAKFKIVMQGNISLIDDNTRIKIEITKAKLPLGIPATKLSLYFLRKYMVSEDITFEDNIIYINI